MFLSLFCASLLFAAGSNASPCTPRNGNLTSSISTTGSKLALHRDGHGSAAGLSLVKTSGGSGSNSTVASSPGTNGTSGTSITSGSLTSASGSCPTGFLNVVFNTNAGQAAGFPSTTWSTLTSYGISNWIGFSLETLDKQADYGLSATQASQLSGPFNAAQIPIVMDHTYISTATNMLANNPPLYMELYNEPDFSFENLTLTEDAAPSASDLSTLLTASHPNTTYISPALMNANGAWLSEFFQACNGCIDQIDVIALHVYNPDPQGVLDQITQLYNTWKKPIWITELSPATSGCGLTPSTMSSGYIDILLPKIIQLGYVEKIFWNSGEPDSTPINSAPAPCSPSLTNPDGSATAVLQALGAACGIHPGGSNTATS